MINFVDLGLRIELLKALTDLGFEKPMPVQEKVIPLLLEKEQDIVALAQTGTGKTAAFGLPLIQQINEDERNVQALILCPTRELCIQISNDLNDFLKYINNIKVLPVYGGTSIDTQIRALKRGVQIIVATPGRMLDLINRRAANMKYVKTVVLDEADEMLNMGFIETLNEILKAIPEERNTLLFSATMPAEVASIARNYMKSPTEVTCGQRNSSSENVRHLCYMVNERDRYNTLKRIADYNPDIYGIVFCRTRKETQEIADKLIQDGYSADALHGDLSQAQRDYVMQKFRVKNIQLLVATDVAARGIDVNNLTHIINYNLPDDIETYNHRSGRTGRAGKSGISIIITGMRDRHSIRRIEKSVNKVFELCEVPKGRDICEKQLFNLIDRMERVEVDDAQIDSYLPVIFKKLEWLEKEEIIKKFAALEFNRFLNYYKDARDIATPSDDKGRGRKDRDDRRGGDDRRGYDRPSYDRESRRRDDDRRDDRRGKRSDDRARGDDSDKKSKKAEKGFTRLRIDIGKKDGVYPNVLIELINQTDLGKKVKLGQIDLTKKETYFEVKSDIAKDLMKEMKHLYYHGHKVNADIID